MNMSMIITGGQTDGVNYSCMLDAYNKTPDFIDVKTGLYGFEGIAHLSDDPDDTASAVLWFDDNMEFVEGKLCKCCANCDYVGRSSGGFFAECLYFGYQVNDEHEHWCEEFKLRGIGNEE